MVQIVFRSFIRIRRAILSAVCFLRTKVQEIVDLILNRIIVWLCRHYERNMGFGDGFQGY